MCEDECKPKCIEQFFAQMDVSQLSPDEARIRSGILFEKRDIENREAAYNHWLEHHLKEVQDDS